MPQLLDVIDKVKLQKVQDDFCDGVRCAGIITDVKGNYITSTSLYSSFCKMIQSTEEGRKRCILTASRACADFNSGQPHFYNCHLGLKDCAAPVLYEGKIIGSILVGQFIPRNIDPKGIIRKASSLGANPEEMMDLLKTLYLVNEEKMVECLKLTTVLSELLSELASRHFFILHKISSQGATEAHPDPWFRKRYPSPVAPYSNTEPSSKVIGTSPAMIGILNVLNKIAVQDIPILIHGETGTGKGLIAKKSHELSHRRENPFITLNCASIPESLVESELFGHEKGSFTGALKKTVGKFQLADQGTLFLDEISDMKPDTQAKTLKAIEEGEVTPIGGNVPVKINVRIIAAANQNLLKKIESGEFREDLYYRLNGISIYLPPLRERKEDIVVIAKHFLAYYNKKLNRNVALSLSAEKFLQDQAWVGNIRELKSVIYRSILLKEDGDILDDRDIIINHHIPRSNNKGLLEKYVQTRFNEISCYENEIHDFEEMLIREALRKSENSVSEACRMLGLPRTTLTGKINRILHLER